jgi:hypothetical protein
MMQEMQGKAPEKKQEVNARFEVNKTGNKRKIGGYDCEEVLIKMVTEAKDKEPKEQGKFTLETNLWVSDQVKGWDQIQAFDKKFAEKMGWGEYSEGFLSGMKQFGVDTKELAKKMEEVKGFPMMMVVAVKPEMEKGTEKEETVKEESTTTEEKERMGMANKILGLKGGEKKEQEKGKEGALFKTTITVEDIQVAPLEDSQFELLRGLEKVKVQMPEMPRE